MGENCIVKVTEHFPRGVEACKPIYEMPPDGHSSLSNAELAKLENDPVALYRLSTRRDSDLDRGDRLALLVRAAALADKPGELLQWAYWTRVTTRSYERNLAGHKLRLTLATVTRSMGDERSRPDVREGALREFLELNGSHPEAQIQSAKT